MGELVDKVQVQLRRSSIDFVGLLLKLATGLALGLTVSLIIHEILGKTANESMISFVFIVVCTAGVFMRVAKKWSVTSVLIFDLICILVGMVLRLYIMVAPNM